MEGERESHGLSPSASSPGSAPTAARRHGEEIAKRRVIVEDEWQTAEDWLDAGNYAEASYFLERMISETRKLKLTIEAAVTQEPNGGSELRREAREDNQRRSLETW